MWPFDPTVYAGLAALLFGYATLARHRPDLGRMQILYFLLGALTIWTALETPLDRIGDEYLQSAHMVQHILLGFVAPPLLLLGLSQSMAARLLRAPGLRAAVAPVPAQVVYAAVMLAWHLPVLYGATLAGEGLHVFEHLTFVGAGLLFWWPVVGATAAATDRGLGEAAKIVYLVLGTFGQDTVALVLMFARAPFYEFYVHAPRLVPGLDPLSDQVVAGAALMGVGKISFLIAIFAIVARWLARARAEEAHATFLHNNS
ncbi:MAG: hypothetical protein NVS9B1_04020 [Candidatus Dormibacteraceae bacterium]